jgi:hypothetical protein
LKVIVEVCRVQNGMFAFCLPAPRHLSMALRIPAPLDKS